MDNFSKYGPVHRSFDAHPRYRLVEGDAKDSELMIELAADCDHVVAGAAMIGGISYFHEFAYDLLAENERICAATFDAAISAHRLGRMLLFAPCEALSRPESIFENIWTSPGSTESCSMLA